MKQFKTMFLVVSIIVGGVAYSNIIFCADKTPATVVVEKQKKIYSNPLVSEYMKEMGEEERHGDSNHTVFAGTVFVFFTMIRKKLQVLPDIKTIALFMKLYCMNKFLGFKNRLAMLFGNKN